MAKSKYKALIDVTKGSAGLDPEETYAMTINGSMNYFPLCCSTGILEGFTVNPLKKTYYPMIDSPRPLSESYYERLTTAKYLDEVITATYTNNSFIAPLYFGRWYAMSLLYRKTVHGHDRHGKGAYSGFKAAQITMFDRLLEDKDPAKGFKFTYNMTYAISHLMEWLRETEDKYGTVQISPPVPGAHGARVYGCIFTGDGDALKKYHDERIEVVRSHYMALHEHYKKVEKKIKPPKTAPRPKNFVDF